MHIAVKQQHTLTLLREGITHVRAGGGFTAAALVVRKAQHGGLFFFSSL